MTEVAAMPYEASEHFWNPLAARLDKRGTLPQSSALETLRAMRYTDGSPVLKDPELTGAEFIREVLVELGRVDDVAFRELGYDRWSEENQRSAKLGTTPTYAWRGRARGGRRPARNR